MNTTAARLDLRLNLGDKHRITRAAALRGVPVSAFVREAVLREADSAITAADVVTLSETETRHFLAALDTPFTPTPRLQAALDAVAKIRPAP